MSLQRVKEFRKREERPKIDWESPIDAAGPLNLEVGIRVHLEAMFCIFSGTCESISRLIPVAADAKKETAQRPKLKQKTCGNPTVKLGELRLKDVELQISSVHRPVLGLMAHCKQAHRLISGSRPGLRHYYLQEHWEDRPAGREVSVCICIHVM